MKIDKGIPMPLKSEMGRYPKYPWHEMEVGDSFFVDKELKRMSSGVWNANKRYAPKHYVSRMEGEGTRIWRDI